MTFTECQFFRYGLIAISDRLKHYDGRGRVCFWSFRIITDENGNAHTIKEKTVVYWDRNLYESQIEEYLTVYNLLDEDFKRQMGYTGIITSEVDFEDEKLIKIYNDLIKAEEQLGLTKGELSLQTYLRNEEQADGYFAISVIADFVLRIIQNKVSEKSGGFSPAMSFEEIRNALNKWTVDTLPDKYYRFNNVDDKDLKLILEAFGINIPEKIYRLGDLKTIKQSFDIC